jgi:uncharacterized repeat protein (TIGR02543 family)
MIDIPIFHPDAASIHFRGTARHWFEYTQEDIETMDIISSVSDSISFAKGVIEENTKAKDKGGASFWEEWLSVTGGTDNIFFQLLLEYGFKQGGENNWNNHTSKTDTDSFEEIRSFESTIEHATSWARGNAISKGFELLPNENRPGHYRYSMFAVSDVYLNVIKNPSTGSLYYEFVKCVVPGAYTWDLEYTDRLPFGKGDESNFIFDLSILDNLPNPNTGFYTVTFDKNNNDTISTEANPQTITVTSQLDARNVRPPAASIGTSRMPAAPERNGFTFGGWRTTRNGNITFNGNTLVSANTTVFAHWISIPTYPISIASNPTDGGVVNPSSISNIAVGGRVNITATPTTPHFRFANWSRVSGGTVTFDNANSANTWITLTSGQNTAIRANFERIPRALTTIRNPAIGGSVTINGTPNPTLPLDVASGTPIPISATPVTGYGFINWTLITGTATFGNPNSMNTTVTLSSNATISANFGVQAYTLTVTRNNTNRGTTIPASQQHHIAHGVPFSISATPANSNFRFDRWEVVNGFATFSNANSASTTVTLTSNATIRANFLQRDVITETYPKVSGRYVDTYSFSNFSANIPAIVEIYALGAGGGGQGGHSYDRLANTSRHGTGGAGGGGAAAFLKFETTSSIPFTITVGKGGGGGIGRDLGLNSWRSGGDGGTGGSTIVVWNGNTLTVPGGQGGGVGRNTNFTTLIGGDGGGAATMPSAILSNNWLSAPGGKGADGAQALWIESRGGNPGTVNTVNIGSRSSFSGGVGGYNFESNNTRFSAHAGRGAGGTGRWNSNNSGMPGGDGQVIIVITRFIP